MMEDRYWMRLVQDLQKVSALAKEHPMLAYPDVELEKMLTSVTEDEAAYEAPAVGITSDLRVDHETGSFGIRVYSPASTTVGRPLLVWCHGGGWAAGDLEGPEADATAREICTRADAVVVSVDYRLAREGVHFPAPLDDVVAAYRWALEHAAEFGADPERITLAGASAGGNLAAGAALWLRDHHLPMPASLALAYPTLHPEMPTPSSELQAKLDRMNRIAGAAPEVLEPMIENYLGGPSHEASPYAMPGVAGDLTSLPPTYIFNNEFDGLRASAEEFAAQLAVAGNFVVLETLPGVAHGHFSRPGLAQSRDSHRDLAAWVLSGTVPRGATVVPISPSP